MEVAASVSEAVLACAELTEVLGCLGDDIVVKLEDNTTFWLSVDRNVELYAAPVSILDY